MRNQFIIVTSVSTKAKTKRNADKFLCESATQGLGPSARRAVLDAMQSRLPLHIPYQF
jgi:hypothetical protein